MQCFWRCTCRCSYFWVFKFTFEKVCRILITAKTKLTCSSSSPIILGDFVRRFVFDKKNTSLVSVQKLPFMKKVYIPHNKLLSTSSCVHHPNSRLFETSQRVFSSSHLRTFVPAYLKKIQLVSRYVLEVTGAAARSTCLR